MTRAILLGGLVSVFALTLAVVDCARPPADVPKVAAIEKVRDNLYVVKGGGGNTAVFIAGPGVTLVDTKLPEWGQPLLDAIRTITNRPVTTLINTHAHQDHVGNNGAFGIAVEIIAHENAAVTMSRMEIFAGDHAGAAPGRVFQNTLSLMSGSDRIDLYYFGAGHTNGDIWVVFPALGVMHAGDMFAEKAPPVLDIDHGGSGVAFPRTAASARAGIRNVDTVITGHSAVVPWSDFEQYVDFNEEFLAWARGQIKAGKTLDEAADAYTIPARYAGYINAWRARSNLKQIYRELSGNDVPRSSWWSRVQPLLKR